MALPNFAAAPQQEGLSPSAVQQTNTQNQKIAEILSNITAKLNDATNVRSTLQSATFDAFGNNFLTRGAFQLGDAFSDTLQSLFGEEKKEPEDPVIVAIKEQSKVLSDFKDSSISELKELSDAMHLNRLDSKNNRSLERAENDHIIHELININKTLLDFVSGRGGNGESSRPKYKSRKPSVDSGQPKIVDSSIEDADIPEDSDKESANDKKETERRTANDKKTETFLTKILNTLLKTNKNLEDYLKSSPISTQESDLERLRAMQDPKKVTDINPGEKSPKSLSFMDKMLDFGANMRGLTNIIKALGGGLLSIVSLLPGLGKIIPLLISGMSAIVKMVGKVIPGVGDILSGKKSTPDVDIPNTKPKTPPVKIGGSSKILNIAKGVGAAAIMTGAVMGIDAVAGSAGVGKEVVDVAQDDKNWDRASTWEKIQSAPSRAIEKVGSFIGAENISNAARISRINKETEYLNNRDSEIEAAKKTAAEKPKQQVVAQPSIVDAKTINNNQTIMPTRVVVTNKEPSFNRYLDSILSPRH